MDVVLMRDGVELSCQLTFRPGSVLNLEEVLLQIAEQRLIPTLEPAPGPKRPLD
jgi:hypothetical protein